MKSVPYNLESIESIDFVQKLFQAGIKSFQFDYYFYNDDYYFRCYAEIPEYHLTLKDELNGNLEEIIKEYFGLDSLSYGEPDTSGKLLLDCKNSQIYPVSRTENIPNTVYYELPPGIG